MKKFIILGLLVASQAIAAKSFKTEHWHTANGVRVVFYQAMEVPMLEISLAFAAGSAWDGKAFGLSTLTNQLMDQGSTGMDADAVAEALADTGAQFDANSSREMAVLNLKTLTEAQAFSKATDIFAKIIAHPEFSEEAFQREKTQQLMAIRQTRESPEDVANIAFFNALYQDHPYAHPVNGTAETVNHLQRDQVRNFYKHYYGAKNAILVLVGAIDSGQAHALAEKLTRDLQQGQAAPPVPMAHPLAKAQDIHIPFPSSQTVIRLGELGIDHHVKNYFPLIVGNYILGGGSLVSQLALEVRGKRGLTYGISSQFLPMSGEGPFIINFATKNNQAEDALVLTKNILRDFVQKGPKPEELMAAKQFLTGSFPLSLASNRNIANLLLKMAFFHLPDNYPETYTASIQAVTLEEIKAAFQEQLQPGKQLTIMVGQA